MYLTISLISQLMKLIQRVEATFIKHFANGNRRKGMNILRPQIKRERHRLTFSTGRNRNIIYTTPCIFSNFDVLECFFLSICSFGFRFLCWMRVFSYSGSFLHHTRQENLSKGRPQRLHDFYVPSL